MKKFRSFKPLRPVAIAALCVCLLVGSAFAADAATDGAITRTLTSVFGDQIFSIEILPSESEDDVVVTLCNVELTDLPDNAVSVIAIGETAGVYLTSDGRVMLREAGKDDVDVTDVWANGGSFSIGGKQLTVETVTDSNGNIAYCCDVEDADSEDDFLSSGILFDPDSFDLNVLPGFSTEIAVEGDSFMTEDGEVVKSSVYTFTEVPED